MLIRRRRKDPVIPVVLFPCKTLLYILSVSVCVWGGKLLVFNFCNKKENIQMHFHCDTLECLKVITAPFTFFLLKYSSIPLSIPINITDILQIFASWINFILIKSLQGIILMLQL